MEKVRKIKLDKQSIQKAIKDLEQIEKNINSLPIVIEEILTEAVTYCKSITPISDNQGNHLVHNTYWEKTSKGYRIVQEGDNIAYVEFGTGIIGQSNPHESRQALSQANWHYGVGRTIFTTKDGRTGWFYPENEARTSWKFTEGQIANMQMYKTALWLEEKLGIKVKYIVDKAVSKW